MEFLSLAIFIVGSILAFWVISRFMIKNIVKNIKKTKSAQDFNIVKVLLTEKRENLAFIKINSLGKEFWISIPFPNLKDISPKFNKIYVDDDIVVISSPASDHIWKTLKEKFIRKKHHELIEISPNCYQNIMEQEIIKA